MKQANSEEEDNTKNEGKEKKNAKKQIKTEERKHKI